MTPPTPSRPRWIEPGPRKCQWRSTMYAARYYGRTMRCIEYWCTRGTFTAFNIPTYQDSSLHWWILIEDDPPVPPVT